VGSDRVMDLARVTRAEERIRGWLVIEMFGEGSIVIDHQVGRSVASKASGEGVDVHLRLEDGRGVETLGGD
jgi:hypothetical protein